MVILKLGLSQCTHEFIYTGIYIYFLFFFLLVDEQTGEPSPKRKKLSESKFVVINRSFYLLYMLPWFL